MKKYNIRILHQATEDLQEAFDYYHEINPKNCQKILQSNKHCIKRFEEKPILPNSVR